MARKTQQVTLGGVLESTGKFKELAHGYNEQSKDRFASRLAWETTVRRITTHRDEEKMHNKWMSRWMKHSEDLFCKVCF